MTAGDDTARIFAERYVLDHQLTTGDSREVWKAHDDLVGRAVALKIWFGAVAADPDWRARFRHSASRLAAFSHPGVTKCHDFETSDSESWLVSAYIDGVTLSEALRSETPTTTAAAIDIVGQVGIAIGAAHDAGIIHGRLTADAVMVRPDDVAAVIGFAVDGDGSRADDIRAIGALAAECITATTSPTEPTVDVAGFVNWVTATGGSKPPTSAAEIGRTALALAAGLRGGASPNVVPASDAKPEKSAWRREETPEQEASRKQVRNRLLVLGTIVVVGGAGLLRFVGKGGGDVIVPTVTQVQVNQAALKLTTAGLVPIEVCKVGKDSGGVVVSQFPTAGDQVKAGTTVHLTVRASAC